jgi:hypothetical protein
LKDRIDSTAQKPEESQILLAAKTQADKILDVSALPLKENAELI